MMLHCLSVIRQILFFMHLTHGMNIACFFDPIREASVKVLTDYFSIAAEIGAGIVIPRGIMAGNRNSSRLTGSLKIVKRALKCCMRTLDHLLV
jgi:hypothetical protein